MMSRGRWFLRKYDLFQKCHFSSGTGTGSQLVQNPDVNQLPEQRDTISKAMQAYMDRAQEHGEFMKEQEKEFVFGKRHLANMMGKDPETFNQDDINEAIRYLFPSGLHIRARPIMRPPDEIYPKQKAAQFDKNGRPFNPFFYTAQPGFFQILHELVAKINVLNLINSQGLISGIEEPSLAGTIWLSKEELEVRLLEKILDKQYEEFILSLDRLASHQHASREVEFIKQFRKPLAAKSIAIDLPPITLDPDGTKSVSLTEKECYKKSAKACVTVKMPGQGLIKINDKDLDYFNCIQSREIILFPLQLTKMLGTVDVFATVHSDNSVHRNRNHSGSCEACAIRFGISMALAALGADKEKLRLAGLLTKDWRRRERSKIAHDGARAAWTWKKR